MLCVCVNKEICMDGKVRKQKQKDVNALLRARAVEFKLGRRGSLDRGQSFD